MSVVQDIQAEIATMNHGELLHDQIPWLEELHRKYFDQAVGPGGDAWKPLSPRTAKKKGHGKILIDKRRLVRSLTERGFESVRKIDRRHATLEFGTRVPYSIYHQRSADMLLRTPGRSRSGSSKKLLKQPMKSKSSIWRGRGLLGALRGLLKRAYAGVTKLRMKLRGLRSPRNAGPQARRRLRESKVRRERPHVGLSLDTSSELSGRIVDDIIRRLAR